MIRFHDNNKAPADRFQVIGERCSGTNFLHHLIVRNLPELQVATPYHWKHGFIDRRFAAEDGLLTVVIYRHPLRWLHAVHNHPWNLTASMQTLPFSAFIRAEWRAAWEHAGREELIQGDMQPHTTTPFANALRLRSAKIEWLEELARLPGKTAFLRYEDVNRFPLRCLRALAEGAGLMPPARLARVDAYKGDRPRVYFPRPQPRTSDADMAFIRQELNLTQERAIGYDPADVPALDGLPPWDRRALRARLRRFR